MARTYLCGGDTGEDSLDFYGWNKNSFLGTYISYLLVSSLYVKYQVSYLVRSSKAKPIYNQVC